jgi:hypothetical protein
MSRWNVFRNLLAAIAGALALAAMFGSVPAAAQDPLPSTGRTEFYLVGHIVSVAPTAQTDPVFQVGDTIEYATYYKGDERIGGDPEYSWAEYTCPWCTDKSWLRVGSSLDWQSQMACGEHHAQVYANYVGWAGPTDDEPYDMISQVGSFCDGAAIYPRWVNLVYWVANPAGAIEVQDGYPLLPRSLEITNWQPAGDVPWTGRLEYMAQDQTGPIALEVAYFEVDYAVFRPEHQRYHVCLLYEPTAAHQSGSTMPIKFQLCDADGVNQSSAAIPVTATGVYQVSTSAPGALEDAGHANPDFNFRFTDSFYIFNLSLKGYSQGTYALTFMVGGDPDPYSVQFQVK